VKVLAVLFFTAFDCIKGFIVGLFFTAFDCIKGFIVGAVIAGGGAWLMSWEDPRSLALFWGCVAGSLWGFIAFVYYCLQRRDL